MIESAAFFLVVLVAWTFGGLLLERFPRLLKWIEKVVTK